MKFLREAQQFLQDVTVTGDEVNARCPYHDDSSPSLSFNVRKGVFYCHGCQASGTARQLFREQAALSGDLQSNLELLDAQISGLKAPVKETKVRLPETTLNRYRFYTRYWKRRGFDEDTVDWWDLGYDPLSRRLTIPLRDTNGYLLGCIYRRIGSDGPKYKYPAGFSRSRNLFGSWKITTHRTVCLVEGSLDVVRAWQAGFPSLAIYGSSVSQAQVSLIYKLGIRRAVLFYDADDAGRSATEQSLQLIRKIEVRQVDWSPRHYRRKADPGGLSLEDIGTLVHEHFDDSPDHA